MIITGTATPAELRNALDATTSDTIRWDAGYEAFKAAQADGKSKEDAYHAALDVAAPDEESRQKGYMYLVLTGELPPPETEESQPRKPFFARMFGKKEEDKDTPWKVFFRRSLAGAFLGLMAGAAVMFVLFIALLIGGNDLANGNALAAIVLVSMTFIGAGLGYASAAKYLGSLLEDQHDEPTEPTTQTA